MRHERKFGLLLLVILATIALPTIYFYLRNVSVLEGYSQAINTHLVYQFATLLLAIMMLLVLRLSRKEVFRIYFRRGNFKEKVIPEPYVGIKPKPQETWAKAGFQWAFMISIVTATVMYFQVYQGLKLHIGVFLKVLPFALLFSMMNSFVEESIIRLGVIVALKGVFPDRAIAIISGLLFGSVHYFGNPGGVIGVLVAGFLGWFLAKSILETKGMFWAWFIHFIQDVIILIALFMLYP